MTTEEFWALVDTSRAGSDDDLVVQCELLGWLLERLDTADLLAFDAEFQHQTLQLYRREVLDATEHVIGPCSDDVFTDVRSWLVSRGRGVCERVVANVDQLAPLLEDAEDLSAGELFAAVLPAIYAEHTGADIVRDRPGPWGEHPDHEPVGDPLPTDPDVLAQRYPRLAAQGAPALPGPWWLPMVRRVALWRMRNR